MTWRERVDYRARSPAELTMAALFSEAIIRVDKSGGVVVKGRLSRYAGRIEALVQELGLRNMTIKYRNGRYIFPRELPPAIQQRLRNFLVNECPLTNEST